MTHDEINTLHMSGMQFPLDSDEIDKALAAANLDPQTCTYAEAMTACQEFVNATRAFRQQPTRGGRRTGAGAPRGNKNNKRPTVRENKLLIHLTADEQATIAAAAGSMPVARWVREAALEKANQPLIMKTKCLISVNDASYLAEVEPAHVIKATRYYEGGAIGLANGVTLNLPAYTDSNGNAYKQVRKINERWKPGHRGVQWGYVLDGNYTLLAEAESQATQPKDDK